MELTLHTLNDYLLLLEEKGLLLRRLDQQDRRTVHLELTGQGRTIAAEAREKQVRYFSALYRGVSPEEAEIWRKIVTKIRENIKNIEISEDQP